MRNRQQCTEFYTLLPLYANERLPEEQRATVARHLDICTHCQAEVHLWQLVGIVIQEDTQQIRKVQQMGDTWQAISTRLSPQSAAAQDATASFGQWLRLYAQIVGESLRSQIRIVRHDFWWISLLGIPIIASILFLPFTWQARMSTSAFIAPLITALGMSFLYSQDIDPAHEMIRATPTSSHVILIYRFSVVFIFNLFVNVVEVLPFLINQGDQTLQWVLSSWFAPLCCLTSLALLLSVIVKPFASIVMCSILWLLRIVMNPSLFVSGYQPNGYENFWHQDTILLGVTVVALMLTFILLERKEEGFL